MDNFSTAVMCYSKLAFRLGIDNSPEPAILGNLEKTVAAMEGIRLLLRLPLHLISGYRCEELERIHSEADYQVWCSRLSLGVNSATWLQYFSEKAHPKGLAADFTCTAFGSPQTVVEAIAASPIAFDQCIAEGTWVHISVDPRKRREVLFR